MTLSNFFSCILIGIIGETHEHEDDIGLLFLPGYHVRERFFHKASNSSLVDHKLKGHLKFI